MSDRHTFERGGRTHSCSLTARFLVETANGTSSYTLERGGFSSPWEAMEYYDAVAVVGSKRKRLTMIDRGKRTVLARSP